MSQRVHIFDGSSREVPKIELWIEKRMRPSHLSPTVRHVMSESLRFRAYVWVLRYVPTRIEYCAFSGRGSDQRATSTLVDAICNPCVRTNKIHHICRLPNGFGCRQAFARCWCRRSLGRLSQSLLIPMLYECGFFTTRFEAWRHRFGDFVYLDGLRLGRRIGVALNNED